MSEWEILDSKYIIANQWVRLRKDRCKTTKGVIIEEYYVHEGDDAALVFCITPEGNVPLLQQYRHGVKKTCFCLPGGKIEDRESADEAVKRELLEETGHEVVQVKQLGKLAKSPANSNSYVFVFLATLGERIHAQQLDPGEEASLLFVPLKTIPGMISDGSLDCALCIAAIHLAQLALQTKHL